jgi:hypothetical protein
MRAIWDALSNMVMAAALALPLWAVKGLVIAGLLALAVWAMRMPRQYAFKGAPGEKWYYDVRIWAVAVIFCEILPYLFF